LTIFENAMWRTASVRTVLELEIFRRAGAFLAAGQGGLDRPLRWVHSGESKDIATFLSGGELLLTSGQGIGQTEAEQRQFVASLANVGAAALAVELAGKYFTQFPHALTEEADKHRLPLIGLPVKIAFVEASAQVLQELTNATTREFTRSYEISNFLSDRLLSGADHIALIHDFASRLGRPIILESVAHEIKAYYGVDDEPSSSFVADWPAHSRSPDIHAADAAPAIACRRIPIVLQGTEWGWIHMPAMGLQNNHVDNIALGHAASAIAISLLNTRVTRARSAHHQGILINRLMVGDISGTGFVQRSLQIGHDLRGMRLVVAVISSRTKSLSNLEAEINAELRDRHLPAVMADIGQSLLAVIGLKADYNLKSLAHHLESADRCIGFSKLVESDALPAAAEQARAAASTRRNVQFFDDLGLLRILVPLSNGPELDQYVEDELGPLLEYEVNHEKGLLETLAVFLSCDGNKSDAATKLFLHRRSLYYRLDKIAQILNRSLDDPETRLRLQIAVRSLRLVRKPLLCICTEALPRTRD
jgi:purine catabolism regulator